MPTWLDPTIIFHHRGIITSAKYTLSTWFSLKILALQCANLSTNGVISHRSWGTLFEIPWSHISTDTKPHGLSGSHILRSIYQLEVFAVNFLHHFVLIKHGSWSSIILIFSNPHKISMRWCSLKIHWVAFTVPEMIRNELLVILPWAICAFRVLINKFERTLTGRLRWLLELFKLVHFLLVSMVHWSCILALRTFFVECSIRLFPYLRLFLLKWPRLNWIHLHVFCFSLVRRES